MISYAQNFEDVLLNRFFRGKEKGTYVDIGAYDPEELSVTKHFYDQGWSGINVEPSISAIQKFLTDRPRDKNIRALISVVEGTIPFFDVPGTGCSSLSRENAESAGAEKSVAVDEIPTPSLKLETVLRLASSTAKVIDFLKVDVEGAEYEVLVSNDWSKYRPVVVVYEAVPPGRTPIEAFNIEDKAAHVLTENGYIFMHFDGLNKYFVRKEDWSVDVSRLMSYPACTFDDFKVSTPFFGLFHEQLDRSAALEKELGEVKDRCDVLDSLLRDSRG